MKRIISHLEVSRKGFWQEVVSLDDLEQHLVGLYCWFDVSLQNLKSVH